jgi:hypothetical protein
MPLVVKDRVRETTTTTGTGTVTLAGAVAGFQSFSAIGNANTTYYTINLPGVNEWEVGIGTYTASGTTLSRDTILASSNGGSAVNFSAGTKDVFCTYPAGKSAYLDAANNLLIGTTTNTNTSNIVANGTISETVSGTQYLVASQFDVGTNPNQIPLNQYLGDMAFQSSAGVSIGILSVSGAASFTNTTDSSSTTTGAITTAGGVGIAKKLYVGLDANIYGITVGRGAGAVATNTAVGASALAANTSGSQNTVVGFEALKVATASNNTAVGTQTLFTNTSGTFNTGVGLNALAFNTTGSSNTAVGDRTLFANTTGLESTAVGGLALNSSTTGSYNTAVGRQALTSNTTASNNTAVGYQAGFSNQTGFDNTIVGVGAAYNAVTSYNTIIGLHAGYAFGGTSSGNGANVMVGWKSGYKTTSGSGNTFIGTSAGYENTTGTQNTFVGPNTGSAASGFYVTTGSKNTILGAYSGNQGGLDIRASNNHIVLSDGDGNPRWVINESGTVTTSPRFNAASTLDASGATVTIRGNFPVTPLELQQDTTNNHYQVTFRNNLGTTAALVGSINSEGSYTNYNTGGNSSTATQLNYQGVQFAATQNASSNANTLDDYEEGAWTPVWVASGGGLSATYSEQVGRYTKIGKIVYFHFRAVISAASGGTGNLLFGGLPFVPASSVGNPGFVSLNFSYGWTGADAVLTIIPVAGSTNWDTYTQYAAYNANTQTPVGALTAGGTIYLIGGGCYEATA